MAAPTRRSRRIASQEPEELDPGLSLLLPVQKRAPKRVLPKAKPKPALNKQAPPKFYVNDAYAYIVATYKEDDSYMHSLTKKQLIDIIKYGVYREVVHARDALERERDDSPPQLPPRESFMGFPVVMATPLQRMAADAKIAAAAAASVKKVEPTKISNPTADTASSPPVTAAVTTTPAKTTPKQISTTPSALHSSTSSSPPTTVQRVSLSDETTAVQSPVTSTSPVATPAPKWRSYIRGAIESIASPFARKRSAETADDDDTAEPTAKRVRREEPAIAAPSSSPPVAPQTVPAVVVSSARRPLFDGPSNTPSRPPVVFTSKQYNNAPSTPSRAVNTSTTPSAKVAQTEPSRKRRAPIDEPEDLPKETPKHRSQYLGPSTTNPRVPTSLSVISERTEISRATATPMSAANITPSRKPRSIVDVRRAREARQKTPTAALYAWEQPVPQPKEPNADARYAKMQRMAQLQREIDELKQDKDIIEMQSHKRKRVKVDHLDVIPHNRPGDPTSMFRVPDIDSDDEIEIEDDGSTLRSNIFEEAAKLQPTPQPAAAPEETDLPMAPSPWSDPEWSTRPPPKWPTPPGGWKMPSTPDCWPSSGILEYTPREGAAPAAAQEHISPTPAPNYTVVPEHPVFNFPNVGARDLNADPYLSTEEEEIARIQFVAGLQAAGVPLDL